MTGFDEGRVRRSPGGQFAEKPPASEAGVGLDPEPDENTCVECGRELEVGEGRDGLCDICDDPLYDDSLDGGPDEMYDPDRVADDLRASGFSKEQAREAAMSSSSSEDAWAAADQASDTERFGS